MFVCLYIYSACRSYKSAKLIIECIGITASSPTDRKILSEFAQSLENCVKKCEETKSNY